MLQAIRSKATSLLVKLLFGLLIVTFGLWGIGDIFLNGSGPDNTVAKVGDEEITADQVNQQVQAQIQQLSTTLGTTIDTDQAKKLGVVDQALDGLVSNALVDLEIQHMGLAVSDDAVRDAIVANPAFHNEAGQFDRGVYEQVLAANNMTDAQFETEARADLLKAQLTNALGAGITAPKELVDTIYRARAERRVADLVTIPESAAGDVGIPTEDQIDAYYKAHPDLFQAPELRSFTVAMLRPDDVAKSIAVSDDEAKQYYDQHASDFQTPEEREVEQMLLPDQATAQAAEAALVSGKSFAAVAKDVAKMDDPASLELGLIKASDLPPDLAGPVFKLQQGEVTAPIKSEFGWHILRVTRIAPATRQSFDQVKAKLQQQIARDQAADRIADVANNIDDAMAGGASFDEVVKKFQLETVNAANVTSDGKDMQGKAVALPADSRDAIVKTAFSTDAGETSPLQDMSDNGSYLVHAATVTPAETRPLSEVHDLVIKDWQADARHAALQKIADQMVKAVAAGRSLADVAAEQHLGVTTSPPLLRTADDAQIPSPLVAQLFDAKQGAAVSQPTPDGVVVAQVAKVEPADPNADPDAVKQLAQELDQGMQGDVLDEYDRSLRQTFPVETDQAKLDQLL